MPEITIPQARRLVAEITELDGSVPETLSNLLDLVESVKAAPPVPNPAGKLVDAAVRGEASTAAQISKLVSEAAKAEQEASYWQRLQQRIATDAMKQFAAEFAGAADHILNSLRPELARLAEQITAATAVVDVSWSLAHLLNEGDPDQLAAYRALPGLVAKVDRIARLAADFGPRGAFPVLDDPGQDLLHGLRDEALFVTGFDLGRASAAIRAGRADWKTSPWLRLPLTLNSVAEAAERQREWCEAEWEANQPAPGTRGRLTDAGFVPDVRVNPFKQLDEKVSAL